MIKPSTAKEMIKEKFGRDLTYAQVAYEMSKLRRKDRKVENHTDDSKCELQFVFCVLTCFRIYTITLLECKISIQF